MTARAITSLLAGLALILAACSPSGEEASTPPGATAAQAGNVGPTASAVVEGITVAGAGEATGTPDVVRMTVGVEVERDDAQAALDDANARTQEVLAALDEAGIAPEDRQTQDFSIRPVHREGPDGRPVIRGYMVRNLVEATVRDVDRVGEILQVAAEAGGDDVRIQGVHFDLEDDSEQLAAAREAALEDARAKAEQYAQLAGASLGQLVAIEDQTTGSPREATPAPLAREDAAASVPIEPGQESVIVRVVTRWTLE